MLQAVPACGDLCDSLIYYCSRLHVHTRPTNVNASLSMFHESWIFVPFTRDALLHSSPIELEISVRNIGSHLEIITLNSARSLSGLTRFRIRRGDDLRRMLLRLMSCHKRTSPPLLFVWYQLLSRTMTRFCSPSPKLWGNSFPRWEAQVMLLSSCPGERIDVCQAEAF